MTANTPISPRRTAPRPWRRVLSALAAVSLTAGATLLSAVPAHAAGSVTVTGGVDMPIDAESTLQLSGSGFQSVQGGFGGIYVLFGWIDESAGGAWAPSAGGVTGESYRYVYDDEENPVGYQLFVTFPGSSTSYAANGGEIAADGTWSATLKVPGAVLNTFDRQQNPTTVDCREVTCGVITIGAHGVKNANNESFTPVSFAQAAAAPAVTNNESDGTESAGTTTDAEDSADESEEPAGTAAAAPSASGTSDSSVSISDLTAALAALTPTTAAATSNPGVPLSTVLAIIAVAIVVLTLLILAAGGGGYLATKSILLGVSPEALAKVRAKREEKAQRVELASQLRRARLEQKAAAALAATHGVPVSAVSAVSTVSALSAPPPPPADHDAQGVTVFTSAAFASAASGAAGSPPPPPSVVADIDEADAASSPHVPGPSAIAPAVPLTPARDTLAGFFRGPRPPAAHEVRR